LNGVLDSKSGYRRRTNGNQGLCDEVERAVRDRGKKAIQGACYI
jgi:hypothetical protein